MKLQLVVTVGLLATLLVAYTDGALVSTSCTCKSSLSSFSFFYMFTSTYSSARTYVSIYAAKLIVLQ